MLALAAGRKGFDAVVFEKDLSAIRGEGKYRGPIQIQSNALAALEAIDMDAAEELMAAACITGDRINGLVDGISGTWYIHIYTHVGHAWDTTRSLQNAHGHTNIAAGSLLRPDVSVSANIDGLEYDKT